MRRRWPILLLELVALTLPLTWLWVAWGQAVYDGFFERTAAPLLGLVGIDHVADSPARKRFVSYVPFAVLMLVTPGLAWQRRLGGLLLGVPLIFLCHVALVAVEHLAHTGRGLAGDAFSTILPAALLADAFPFMLWGWLASDVLGPLLARRLGRDRSA